MKITVKSLFPIIMVAAVAALTGCGTAAGSAAAQSGSSAGGFSLPTGTLQPEVTITEKYYIEYVNDIYTNPDDYIGKVIEIEGYYTGNEWAALNYTYHFIYRVGPGCCPTDTGLCGLEFTVEDPAGLEEGCLIRLTAILDTYSSPNGIKTLILRGQSVQVLEPPAA